MPRLTGVRHDDGQRTDLTGKIIGAAFTVGREVGHGFPEAVYGNALAMVLREQGLRVQQQVPLKVCFRGEVIGQFYGDMLVENEVLVELKAVETLLTEHQAQLINYLTMSGLQVGLLINFGRPSVQHKRCYPRRTAVGEQ